MSAAGSGARPIRVLHLRDSPWVDGPGRTILETATRIDRTLVDYHVVLFVADPSKPHPLVSALRERSLPGTRFPIAVASARRSYRRSSNCSTDCRSTSCIHPSFAPTCSGCYAVVSGP